MPAELLVLRVIFRQNQAEAQILNCYDQSGGSLQSELLRQLGLWAYIFQNDSGTAYCLVPNLKTRP